MNLFRNDARETDVGDIHQENDEEEDGAEGKGEGRQLGSVKRMRCTHWQRAQSSNVHRSHGQ